MHEMYEILRVLDMVRSQPNAPLVRRLKNTRGKIYYMMWDPCNIEHGFRKKN
jgi:hypothetical protein